MVDVSHHERTIQLDASSWEMSFVQEKRRVCFFHLHGLDLPVQASKLHSVVMPLFPGGRVSCCTKGEKRCGLIDGLKETRLGKAISNLPTEARFIRPITPSNRYGDFLRGFAIKFPL